MDYYTKNLQMDLENTFYVYDSEDEIIKKKKYEYFYLIILESTNLCNDRLCCKYGMTTSQYPEKYLQSYRYNAYNKMYHKILLLNVNDGKKEEKKFRFFLENIQKIFQIKYHGDSRNEHFEIKNIKMNKKYKNDINNNKVTTNILNNKDLCKMKQFIDEYMKYSHEYDNNIQ